MKKQILLQLPPLSLTNELLDIAQNDVPVKKRMSYYYKQPYVNEYKHSVLMRCAKFNDILKISLFMTEQIRYGYKLPIYEVFIDCNNGDFITYSCEDAKWKNAMLINLAFPGTYYCYDRNVYISYNELSLLSKTLDVENSGNAWKMLINYQKNIREKQLAARHKKTTDVWDADLKQIPSIPKNWELFVQKKAITQHFIIYQYDKKGATRGFCTRCGKYVPIKDPKNNKESVCSCCHKPIIFKAQGRLPVSFDTDIEFAYLLQKCKDGFVIREFKVRLTLQKRSYTQPTYQYNEIRRCIYTDVNTPPRCYYWGDFKHREFRFIECKPCTEWCSQQKGTVYSKNIHFIADLRKTGLAEMTKSHEKIDPEMYLCVYRTKPYIEQCAKGGLYKLCNEVIDIRSRYSCDEIFDVHKSELHKILGIDKIRLKQLRKNNGNMLFLKWLQYAKKRNHILDDNTILWYVKHGVKPDSITFITDRMSEVKIQSYLIQQLVTNPTESAISLINIWKDYFSMAKRCGYNTNAKMIYRPRNLVEKHNQLVETLSDADTTKQAQMISETYTQVDKIISGFSGKYAYSGKKYCVVEPRNIEEILDDSKTLSHCVANTPERYFDRINRNESYILFLRKTNEPDVPYYTIEIEPNATVRQIRTKYNCQGSEIDELKTFLQVWQKVITKNLTKTDIQYGVSSNKSRIKEYQDLRDNNVIIARGTYQGKFLADILEADLMLNIPVGA